MSESLEFIAECECGRELDYFAPEAELGYLYETWVCEECEKYYHKNELYSY